MNVKSTYMPTFVNSAVHDLPKYAGIPFHFVGAAGSGVLVTSCCVHRMATIKTTMQLCHRTVRPDAITITARWQLRIEGPTDSRHAPATYRTFTATTEMKCIST